MSLNKAQPSRVAAHAPETADTVRHQCMIYEGAPSLHLGEIAQTLVAQLKADRRCLYLNSPTMVAGMGWHLAAAGIDLHERTERGALILSSTREHLLGGMFDINKMLRLLEAAVLKALDDGYAGLWAAGDMTWEFGAEKNLDKLLEYERRLETCMQNHPALSGVCLYHRDTLPKNVIQTALDTHRALYVNATLSHLNPHFVAV